MWGSVYPRLSHPRLSVFLVGIPVCTLFWWASRCVPKAECIFVGHPLRIWCNVYAPHGPVHLLMWGNRE